MWKLDLHRFGVAKNVWLSWGMRPMRAWLVQQLVKLAIAQFASEDVLIHADSDTVLIRRFEADMLAAKADEFPVYRREGAVDERLPLHIRWHGSQKSSWASSLGPLPLPDYIGGLIPWRRELACALLDELATRSRRDWMQTLASGWHLSEYILYGRFVDDVVGRTSGPPPTCPSLCHCFWGSSLITNTELEDFIDRAAPSELGVMISANAGMEHFDLLGRSGAVLETRTRFSPTLSARSARRGQRLVKADEL